MTEDYMRSPKDSLHHYYNIVIRDIRRTNHFFEKPGIRCALAIIAGIIFFHIPLFPLTVLLLFSIMLLSIILLPLKGSIRAQSHSIFFILLLIITYIISLRSFQEQDSPKTNIELHRGVNIQISGQVRGTHHARGRSTISLNTRRLLYPGQQNRRISQPSQVFIAQVPAAIEYGTWVEFSGVFAGLTKRSGRKSSRLLLTKSRITGFSTSYHNLFRNRIYAFKQDLIKTFTRFIPSPGNKLLSALLLGDRRGLGQDLVLRFRRAGVIHVLAISGLHLGLLLGFFTLFLTAFSCPRKYIMVSLVVVLVFYLHLVSFRPSIVRATVMAILMIGAVLLRRQADLMNILGATVVLIAINDPQALLGISMQLSVAATFFLIAALPPLNRIIFSQYYFSPLERWFINSLLVSISAWMGVWPLIAFYFNEINFFGIIANLIVVPLIACLLFLGFTLIILSGLSGFAGLLLGKVIYHLSTFTLQTISFFDQSNRLLFQDIPLSIPLVVFYYAGALVFFGWLQHQALTVRPISLPTQRQ